MAGYAFLILFVLCAVGLILVLAGDRPPRCAHCRQRHYRPAVGYQPCPDGGPTRSPPTE